MINTEHPEIGFNFSESENQTLIAQMVKDFAQKYIKPHVMDWDEAQIFPIELFKQLGELGLMGVLVPQEYGGSGLGYFEYVKVIEEISKRFCRGTPCTELGVANL